MSEEMWRGKPAKRELRVKLSNLRDDLAVIESSEIFAREAIGNKEGVNAIRHRIAELESILRLRHHCMHPGCKSWGSFGFDKRDGVEWYCSTHKGDADD
jgi:hypothetical protein